MNQTEIFTCLCGDHILRTLSKTHMTRVTFGVASSPYLAVKALQQTALDFGQDHPKASWHVHASFYVDDLLAGANSPSEALELHNSLRTLLLRGGFNLCKWRSSSSLVTQSIEPSLGKNFLFKNVLTALTLYIQRPLG